MVVIPSFRQLHQQAAVAVLHTVLITDQLAALAGVLRQGQELLVLAAQRQADKETMAAIGQVLRMRVVLAVAVQVLLVQHQQVMLVHLEAMAHRHQLAVAQ
jgi:hypothetical protein